MNDRPIKPKRSSDPRHFILYHGAGCSDGLASSYVAWRKYKDQAEYHALRYGESLPCLPLTTDSEIFVLDFSLPLHVLLSLSKQCKFVQVIDHHKSAYDDFIHDAVVLYTHYAHKSYQACIRTLMYSCKTFYNHVCKTIGIRPPIFDTYKSGAYLTWEYFYPTLPIPDIIRFVSDRDLLRFKYPSTKAAMEGIYFSGLKDSMEYWHSLVNDKSMLDDCIAKGGDILRYRQTIIEGYKRSDRLRILNMGGYVVAIYNAIDFIDEIAEMLYKDPYLNVDYTISYYIRGDGTAKLSFRAEQQDIHPILAALGQDKTVDLIPIAKKWKGGGHRACAGASLSFEQTIDLLKLLNKKIEAE